MTDPMDDDMIPIADAAAMIGVDGSTARSWVVKGVIVGGVRHGRRGQLFVPRSEAVRVRAEREQAVEERIARWQPMTDRPWERSHGPADDEGQHT